ncbi:MAG TPA: hypothetical protein VJM46_00755 [Candidatus Saccharimonadales bacterium]|nr:hypothetical protein [Candidatus Saccharimonadales bacterium]
MNRHRTQARHIRANASKKLRTNLRILSVVCLILIFVTGYNVVVTQAVFWQVVLAIVIGLAAGIVSTRMYKITWNHREAQVIGRMDRYGVIVLVLFVLFELNRDHIARLFVSGESIGTIALVLMTAALYGRILGTAKQILRVLEDEGII